MRGLSRCCCRLLAATPHDTYWQHLSVSPACGQTSVKQRSLFFSFTTVSSSTSSSSTCTDSRRASSPTAYSIAEAVKLGIGKCERLILDTSPDFVCANVLCPKAGQLCLCRFSINISRLTWLKVLSLRNNGIDRWPEIGKLVRLETLDLGSNRLKEIPREVTQLKSLRTLRLRANSSLRVLHEDLWSLPNLQEIDLRETGICKEELPNNPSRCPILTRHDSPELRPLLGYPSLEKKEQENYRVWQVTRNQSESTTISQSILDGPLQHNRPLSILEDMCCTTYYPMIRTLRAMT
eukprot:g24589.t1